MEIQSTLASQNIEFIWIKFLIFYELMQYSRENPSKKYLQLIRFYNEMHEKGYLQTTGKIGNFDGQMVPLFAKIIKKIITRYNCKSLLDYGCGKAKYYFNDFEVKNENHSF